jgi:hypothetical protein
MGAASREWLWKGEGRRIEASIEAGLRVRVSRICIIYYRFDVGHRAAIVRIIDGRVKTSEFDPDLRQSVLSRRKERDRYR